MTDLKNIRTDLLKCASTKNLLTIKRFFKTGPGAYAEHDRFLGVMMPQQRAIARRYAPVVALTTLGSLLSSPFHEERMTALLILIYKYQQTTELDEQTLLYEFYLAQIARINSWDLVDVSAPAIMGAYLLERNRMVLHDLVINESVWQRRIAVVASLYFIRQRDFEETLSLVKKLFYDSETLLQRACGWMLREIGKRELPLLLEFLQKHAPQLSNLALSYATERLPKELRTLLNPACTR